ncbi:MAG: RNA polymerase sigma factor [Coriobacteriia bacterium]|nr:RNA polymerase sigma factor [Coriobacteriia bacterium]
MTSLPNMTDEQLYRAYLKGDERALRTLVERHGENLTLFLTGMVNDYGEARNLMHESFAVAATTTRLFLGHSSFKTWLFGIGRNLALQELRRAKKVYLTDFSEIEGSLPNREPLPQAVLEKEERAQQLHDALQRIPLDYRQALTLVYFQDMSYTEAGRVMGKSQKQVSNLVYRGKLKLRDILEADLDAANGTKDNPA